MDDDGQFVVDYTYDYPDAAFLTLYNIVDQKTLRGFLESGCLHRLFFYHIPHHGYQVLMRLFIFNLIYN